MADKPTTTPERLREILAAEGKLKTFTKWADYRATLTPDEIEDLEAYTQKLPGAVQPAIPPQKITRPAPDLLISRTPYPKWWKDSGVAPIELLLAGTQIVIHPTSAYKIYIASIALTVSGETVISFGFGALGSSGPMYFGGTNQPMGIVIPMADSPAPCGMGGFSVTSSGTLVSVGGFAVYYVLKN